MVKLTGTAYRKMQKNLEEANDIMDFFNDAIAAETAARDEEARHEKLKAGEKKVSVIITENNTTKDKAAVDVNKLLKQAEEKVNKRTANVYTNYENIIKPSDGVSEKVKANFEREAELNERIRSESYERRLYEEEARRLQETRLAFERERAEFFEMQKRQMQEREMISKRDREIENDLKRLAELRRRQDVLAQIVDVNLTEDKNELVRREQYLNNLLYRVPEPNRYNPYEVSMETKYYNKTKQEPIINNKYSHSTTTNYRTKDVTIENANEILKQYQATRKNNTTNLIYNVKDFIKQEKQKITEPKTNVYTNNISLNNLKSEENFSEDVKVERLDNLHSQKETDKVKEKLFEPIIEPKGIKVEPEIIEPEVNDSEVVDVKFEPEEDVVSAIETEIEATKPESEIIETSDVNAEQDIEQKESDQVAEVVETEINNTVEDKAETETINKENNVEDINTVFNDSETETNEENILTHDLKDEEPIKETIVEYDAKELGLDFDTPMFNDDKFNIEDDLKELDDLQIKEQEVKTDAEVEEDDKSDSNFEEPHIQELEDPGQEFDPNNPYGLSRRNIKEIEFIRTISRKELKENSVIKYITSGEEYFQEIIESILSAKKYIAIEVSTIKEGRIWSSIREILKNKALEDIPVYLLYNSFGVPDRPLTSNMALLDKGMFNVVSFYEEQKKNSGIGNIKNKLGSILFGSSGGSGRKRKGVRTLENKVNLKNIIIVDGKICYIGSVGFTDSYANIDTNESVRYVKSAGMKIIGNSTSHYVDMFVKDYNAVTGDKLEAHKLSAPDYEVDTVAFNRTGGLMVSASGESKDIDEIVEQIIFNSSDYVCVAMPYYAITDGILSSLVVAAKTLVDVRVYISPYRIRSDFDGAVKKFEERFGDSGVKLYKYNYGELNCNVVLSDDECVLMGNMPYEATVKTEKSEAYIIGINAIESVKKDILEINDYSVILNEKKKR